ncbi:Tn3 family transposase TnXax1 [Pleomorphomonas sp. T1.2MG-36]|uniref:lytic murein transglycosylase n=1 Tax=Pleomorphomonas sp. T1.2MG-36 TaxID=3041167 RepID=UPI0024776147|nr:lytic murein transglycosylase [Pleomorphomonas sp. T1.2MG-36]CAI9418125.1 Tn3 family transposase TnXax1 [Pleomorphomonas sp. T1.2MG-36]
MKRIAFLLAGALALAPIGAAAADAAFSRWLDAKVWPAAKASGVSRATFEAAVAGLDPDLSLPDLKPTGGGNAFQAEFRSPAAYLADRKLDALAAGARKRYAANRAILDKVARVTGVPAGVVLAVWGKESAFGTAKIEKDAVRTLATQAYMGSRRAEFFPELVAALVILEEEHISRAAMKSSWAGALGQPQFMPTKFLTDAVDGNGDGRRDIWDTTSDVLASIGHYLKSRGWKAGLPWGVEVRLPASVPCSLEGPDQGQPLAAWVRAGVTRADGRPLALGDVGPTGHLLMPAGRMGPAFLVSDNFYVLKAYNESDVYALTIGTVGDRVSGPQSIRGGWGKIGSFSRGDVRAVQRRLEGMGHDVGTADGLVGFRTRVAMGRWQEKNGLPVTCYPDKAVISALK